MGIFGTGMLFGAGLALLLMPKSGPELRRDLAAWLTEIGYKLGNGADAAAGAPDQPV